jgi:hypothetical protein
MSSIIEGSLRAVFVVTDCLFNVTDHQLSSVDCVYFGKVIIITGFR